MSHKLTNGQREIIRKARAMIPPTTYAEIARLMGLDRSTVLRAVQADRKGRA